MSGVVEAINSAGRAFVAFSAPMLIQSSVLVVILFAADLLLRRRVRAVFRYWIWTLVLVKLVLPVSLGSPISVGTWLGGTLSVPLESREFEPHPAAPRLRVEDGAQKTAPASDVDPLISNRDRVASAIASLPMDATNTDRHIAAEQSANVAPSMSAATAMPAPSLSWQGLVFLIWACVAVALLLLLLQRTVFVRGLAARTDPAPAELTALLEDCRRHMTVGQRVHLRISPYATSPAVCGLTRPAILIPQGLASKLQPHELRAVLMHELAHIKRGDLWINVAQTLLQIVYFYNPLVWLANAMIRRVREQAVDETVLVALGDTAAEYPQTLVNIARLALANRPALTLRLIGVVESKSALTARIKHILAHPIPKSARLGLLGVLAILVIAVALLPMAKGEGFGWSSRDVLIRFTPEEESPGLSRTAGDTRVYARNYTVSFKKGEKLAIVAELYQTGQPMRVLGCKTFADPGRPERLSATLTMRDLNKDRTAIEHSLEITLGKESLRSTGVRVDTPEFYNNWDGGFQSVSEIAKKRRDGKTYVEFTNLLTLRVFADGHRPLAPWLWMPGHRTGPMAEDMYFILVRMLPLSRLDELEVDRPSRGGRLADGSSLKVQLPDGSYLSDDASSEQCQAVADDYLLNVKRLVMRERMPLRKLMAHPYYKTDEPIWIYLNGGRGEWKPSLDEIYHDPDTNPCILLIDGNEYDYAGGFDPFGGGSGSVEILGNLYANRGQFRLPPGRHTVAFGWKDLDMVDPNDPGKPLHFTRLATDPVEFEVVEQLPSDYYRQVYEDGWEDILRRSIEPCFTDDWRKGIAGALLGMQVDRLPFDVAFDVYIQAEGSTEQHHSAELALKAGSSRLTMGCDYRVKELNWDTVGDKRWRIILKPSADVAKKYPPIHEFYSKEFVTDWLTFERSPQFELHRQAAERRKNDPQGYGGTIKADKPVDLDVLGRRWTGQGEAWPLPAGFELGWSPDQGGVLRIDPNSGVRLLWMPEANARLIRAADQSRQRLSELPQSRTTQIVPPKGEPTLIAVLSSEGRVYFVSVTKVNETWANLSWHEDQEATKQLAGGLNRRDRLIANLSGGMLELLAVRKVSAPGQPWYSPDGKVWIDPNTDPALSKHPAGWGPVAGGEGLTYEFVVRCDLPDRTSGPVNVAWRFKPAPLALGGGGSFSDAGQQLFAQAAQFPADATFVDVTIEVANHAITFRHVSLKNGLYMRPTIESRSSSDPDRRAGANLVFSPVMEPAFSNLDRWIDLDHNRVTHPPDSVARANTDEATLKWFRADGIDATAERNPDILGLGCIDLTAVRLPKQAWTDFTGRQLREALRSGETVQGVRERSVQVVYLKGTGALPAVYGFRTREGAFGILRNEGLDEKSRDLKIRYKILQEDKGAGGGSLAEAEKKSGTLGFRIVLGANEVDSAVVEQCKQAMAEGKRPPNGYAWFEVRPSVVPTPDQITCEHNERTYLLLWDDASHRLLADGNWRLREVQGTPDQTGRRAVQLTLDETGGQLLHDLTVANPRHYVAILVEDRIVAIPFIASALFGTKVLIVGQFSVEDVDQIIAALSTDVAAPSVSGAAPKEIIGAVFDPNGTPVSGAQVALSTEKIEVVIQDGKLELRQRNGAVDGKAVETNDDGLFRFPDMPTGTFDLIAAHQAGFARVDSNEFLKNHVVRLERWGRIEGRLAQNRRAIENRISMAGLPNETWLQNRRSIRSDTTSGEDGRFVFEKVPAGWVEVGYLTTIGDALSPTSSVTSRTPVVVKAGETTTMKLGGEGRPIIGRFVPPADHNEPIYFGAGLRSLATSRPEMPRPANYNQMSKREQQDWYRQWRPTPEGKAYSDSIWQDLNWRQYAFRINEDGSFRIEDVIPGKYDLTVWLDERMTRPGRPEEIGGYNGKVEMPAMTQAVSNEPLDLGNLTLYINQPPLHVGDMAPLFEARTLDGNDIQLINCRGKFVLLSFWQPIFNPELDRLKELHKTFSGTGRFLIIGLGSLDTLAEVKKYVAEHKIEWPEIYLSEAGDDEITKLYPRIGMPSIVLVNPKGKIIGTDLREEKLTDAVRKALGQAE